MKRFGIVVVVLLAGFLLGQTTVIPWLGTETQQTVANCVLHNTDSVICFATDGIEFSYQGAPFVKVASPGATGPQGPAGPAGPQGPPGPVQSFGTNKCTTVNGSASGWVESGCTQSTP